jgi:hypothetical protein
MIEFYVEGAMRMQLRLRNFFMDVMSGGATATAVLQAATAVSTGGTLDEPDDPHEPSHSTAHMHVTWEDFLGFAKICDSHEEIAREPLSESQLMAIFSKFHSVNLEDIVDEEFHHSQNISSSSSITSISGSGIHRKSSGSGINLLRGSRSTRSTRSISNDSASFRFSSDELDDIIDDESITSVTRQRNLSAASFFDSSDYDEEAAQAQAQVMQIKLSHEKKTQGGGGKDEEETVQQQQQVRSIVVASNSKWGKLKSGGLESSVKVENHEQLKLNIKMKEEAKLLAAICYQNGLYLPFEAGTHVDEEVISKSVQLWSTK